MVRAGEAHIHFGKNYYARLRALYAEDSGLDGMLALGTDLPEPRLFAAFAASSSTLHSVQTWSCGALTMG